MFSFKSKKAQKSINVNEISSLIGKVSLIDIREPYEYASGHIPSAKNIPMNNILTTPEKYLNKDKEYYIVCQSGSRSSTACNILTSKGFNVINVGGGTGSYSRKLE